MTKIPIITQNFSSPDGFNDAPLMLLPQAPPLPLSDKDQEGFSQLLLHDLHRHRQSYVRSYTAFETLKKRQDFILRQESLRALQNFEQRMISKKEQHIDQSLHSYEQCFVKVINANSITNRNIHDQPKRPQTAGPSFDKFHNHQLSHMSNSTQESSIIVPFNRYKKTHRPSVTPKYRSNTSIYRSAQSFHDAFQSSSFLNQTPPFLSFTEGYLQKYGDRSSGKFQLSANHDAMDELREKNEDEQENEQVESTIFDSTMKISTNRKQIPKSRTPDLHQMRTTLSSRNTNTPSSTPQIGYHDALRDGLTTIKDDDNHSNKMSAIIEKRRSSQQSTSQVSNNDTRTTTKRPKTAKKKQTTVDSTIQKKIERLTTKTTDSDLLKKAMTVQNYGNNTIDLNPASNIERDQLLTTLNDVQIRKPSSGVRRSSLTSNDDNSKVKQHLDNIDTQMKTSAKTTTPLPTERVEPVKEENAVVVDNDKEKSVQSSTNESVTENKQSVKEQLTGQKPELETIDNRKRVKKSAFDADETMNDMIAFELAMMGNSRSAMKKSKLRSDRDNHQNGDDKVIPENQETLDLIEKIRQSSNNLGAGDLPVSLQGCRFELPFDLKLLETLTPLEYLSKYCRLSSRRNYQFKRLFDKYRNTQYRFESNNLYTSVTEIHRDNFTRSHYESLCQLINIGNEQHQFTFDTYSGILALCERMLCDPKTLANARDEQDLAKDALEKCDFECLDRKLSGLLISEPMRKLLKTI